MLNNKDILALLNFLDMVDDDYITLPCDVRAVVEKLESMLEGGN